MSKDMELTRPQRLTRLALLDAPTELLGGEIQMCVREYMSSDLKSGKPTGYSWLMASWALFVLLSGARKDRDLLRREVRALRRTAKQQSKQVSQ